MFAIVQAGGRQEKVVPGTVVVVDRIAADPGAEVTFDKVLLVQNDGDVVTGTPYLTGAAGRRGSRRGGGGGGGRWGEEAGAEEKKLGFLKMKRRKQYRKTQGHRTQ